VQPVEARKKGPTCGPGLPERERHARVSGYHAGSTCPRGRHCARALLGLGRRWAERKVEEEADRGEKKAGHVREKKRRVGRGEAGERAG
jgi:hypothetical protein